jgi:uncharacterized protein DUF3306
MAADEFFARWARRKSDAPHDPAPAPDADASTTATRTVADASQIDDSKAKPLPSLEDVANLGHDSDYSVFMASGVDEAVKRSAMKKLFTNPHFNIMDGLDIYIGDYNKFEPITPEILAALNHAKALLNPLAQFEAPLMGMLDNLAEKPSENRMEAEKTASESGEQIAEIADQAQLPENTLSQTASKEVPPIKQDAGAEADVKSDQEDSSQSS